MAKLYLLLLLIAIAVSASRVPLESRRASTWWSQAPTPVQSEQLLKLTIALKQRNIPLLEAALKSVSDPNSPQYGQYWDMERIQALVRPSAASVRAVTEWLITSGARADKLQIASDHIEVEVSVELAETLLGCRYAYFTHAKHHKPLLRCVNEYTVPVEVAEHIELIGGVRHFPKITKSRIGSATTVGAKRAELFVDPVYLRQIYNVGDIVGTNKTNSQSVAQFLEEYFWQYDLDLFHKGYWPAATGTPVTTIGPNPGPPGTEASLDIQYITG